MDKRTIGKLVNYERNKNKISVQKLTEGVCSVSALVRLENGERMPDFFVLERIFERLGKSINKIEYLYDEAIYEIYYLREMIESHLERKEYEEVREALSYYAEIVEDGNILHQQYIYMIKAVLAAEEDDNHLHAFELVDMALRLTVPKWSFHNLNSKVLGEGELVLLLMWIQEKLANDKSFHMVDGEILLQYIERTCSEEEVKANIYCKAAWVLGTMAIKASDYMSALQYSIPCVELLTRNSLLLHLPQFLERIVSLAEREDVVLYRDFKKMRDALKSVSEEYGETWVAEELALWKNYRQQEFYLISEVLEQERKIIGQSQEKLADSLGIDQKTVSRIESGKYKPKAGTFERIKNHLEIQRDICSTRIVVEDFRLLEMEREIARLNYRRREEEAEVLYKLLKEELSPEWKENVQYVKYMDTLFAKELGRINAEQAIPLCIEAFAVTREGLSFGQLDKVCLNRTESFIINYIGRCLDELGRKKETIALLERVLQGYWNSKIDAKYHYAALSLLYHHLAIDYEECDDFFKGIKYCDKSIIHEFHCKRGGDLGYALAQRTYTLVRMSGEEETTKETYRQAYQIMKLMKKEKHMISLQKMYINQYGEDID